MSTVIKISNRLLTRIEEVKTINNGLLYGLIQVNAVLVLGCNFGSSIENNLPIGFKELGQIKWIDGDGNGPNSNSHDSHSIFLQYNLKSGQPLTVSIKNKSNEWEVILYDVITEEELWKEWACLRTRFTLKFSIETNASYQTELLKLLNESKVKLLETHKPTLAIQKTEIVLKKDKAMTGIGKNGKVSGAITQTKSNDSEHKENQQLNGFRCLNFDLLPSDGSVTDDLSAAFTNFSVVNSTETKPTEIYFHSLALVKHSLGASQMYEIVLKSIERNFLIVEKAVTNVERSLKTFVFYPTNIGHFISFVYPTSVENDDKGQVALRKQNHIDLNLARPILRRADEYNFDVQQQNNCLINPHIGLKSLVKDGKQYVVKGNYTYHHYMQDNFNDDGWGCAYRSFQTLFSWYRLQGYTSKPIPTHSEIQQCLIDLGDKQKTFLNSRQWIGSTEVSMCLQHFLNVDSRIIHVRSGSEMAQHGPTFAQHFTTYGTPVMIGGGVLAHTILGVDYNSQTNDLKYLVLDPHYTGVDDLDIVQKKGWCAWKSTTFWDKKSFYNFCMPMFPDSVEY